MDKQVKKSILNIVLDVIKIYVKVRFGGYLQSPEQVLTDYHDAKQDIKTLKSDIKSKPENEIENKIPTLNVKINS